MPTIVGTPVSVNFAVQDEFWSPFVSHMLKTVIKLVMRSVADSTGNPFTVEVNSYVIGVEKFSA